MRKSILIAALLVAASSAFATGNHQPQPSFQTGGYANTALCNTVSSSASVYGTGTANGFAASAGVAVAGISLSPNAISGATQAGISVVANHSSTGAGRSSPSAYGEASANTGAVTQITRPSFVQQAGTASSDVEAATTNGTAYADNVSGFIASNVVTPTAITLVDDKYSSSAATSTGRSYAGADGSAAVSSFGGLRVGISAPRVSCTTSGCI